MFARFDENPAMTLQDIKETKRYGRTDGQTDHVKTVYPSQTKFAGGIKIFFSFLNQNINVVGTQKNNLKGSFEQPKTYLT